MMYDLWLKNAQYVEREYGVFVNWEERFYLCPECGEPVYDDDWDDKVLSEFVCPICEDI